MKTKTPYILNIPFMHGEITVVTSDHAEATMKHSARLADAIRKVGVNVLAINCGMSDRRFRGHFYEAHGSESFREPRCIIRTSVCGNLIGERESLDQIVHEAKIGAIIISGWEFASSNSRRRNRLLFYLRELMDQHNIAVIIYSHTANEPVAGQVDRGGIGKLALLAFAIAEIEAAEVLEQGFKRPLPIAMTPQELREFQEGAQLFTNDINRLREDGKVGVSTEVADLVQ